MKKHLESILPVFLMIAILWMSISVFIQAFKCPEMTQTQLFLHIPQSFVLNFKNC
jgi:hypothetical protein